MRIVKLAIAVAGAGDFADEFSRGREAQHAIRAVAIADVEIAVWSEGDIGGHEIDRMRGVRSVRSGIALRPNDLSAQGRFHDLATVDVAVIQKLLAVFPPQIESVGATPKLLAKRTDETALRVRDDNRLAAHARAVNGVPDVDKTLCVLANGVGVTPHQPIGGNEPVMDALIGVNARTHNR